MNREDEIRKLAHELWEKEGRPEGRALEHWNKATQLLAEIAKPARKPVAPKAAAVKATAATKPAPKTVTATKATTKATTTKATSPKPVAAKSVRPAGKKV